MTQVPEIRLRREYGLTHSEFFRSLPAALEDRPYTVRGDCVEVLQGRRRLLISHQPQSERVLGALRLPVTVVEFRFTGCSRAEVEAFMDRFNMHYQRGGG